MTASITKTFLIAFWVLFLSITQIYAQFFFTPGRLVLVTGDTLTGEIREHGNQEIYFRRTSDAPERTYTPSQISSYYVENVNHLSVTITEADKQTMYFMREQIRGYVSLYRFSHAEERLTHAIRLPDKTVIPLRGNLTLLMLTKYLTECSNSQFTRLLNPQAFYNTDIYLERIVNAYNKCVSPSTQSQSQYRPKKRFRFEAGLSAIALQNSWVYTGTNNLNNVYYNPNGPYSPTYTAALGGFFTIVPRKRLSISVEFLASFYKGNRSVPLTDPLNPTNQNSRLYSFEEHYLTLPITGRYVFIERTIRWYLKGGLVPTLTTSVSGNFIWNGLSLDVPFLNTTNIGMGYLAGIGADIALPKKHRLYVEVRTMPHSVLDGVTRTASSRSFQLMISVPLIKHE